MSPARDGWWDELGWVATPGEAVGCGRELQLQLPVAPAAFRALAAPGLRQCSLSATAVIAACALGRGREPHIPNHPSHE